MKPRPVSRSSAGTANIRHSRGTIIYGRVVGNREAGVFVRFEDGQDGKITVFPEGFDPSGLKRRVSRVKAEVIGELSVDGRMIYDLQLLQVRLKRKPPQPEIIRKPQ
ncbi:hypothetical protein ACFL31_03730 [Candidatus Margulisiibacteriota bacterium]